MGLADSGSDSAFSSIISRPTSDSEADSDNDIDHHYLEETDERNPLSFCFDLCVSDSEDEGPGLAVYYSIIFETLYDDLDRPPTLFAAVCIHVHQPAR